MAGSRWSAAEKTDLISLYPTTKNSDLAAILNGRYGTSRNAKSVALYARKLGLAKAEGHKHPTPRKTWTEDRMEWMRGFVPGHSEREIADAFEERFGIRLTREQVKSGKRACGVRSGTHGGRFEKGREPWVKGRKWREFMSPEAQERSRSTCFKKGNLPQVAQDKPIGYERVAADGYTWVKVAERPTRNDCNDNWRQKHHIVWERANGKPVPPNSMVVFANHDISDFRPENLVAVPRSLWAVIMRNGFQYHDAQSLRACMNLAELKSRIYEVERESRKCKKCGKVFEARYPHQRTCDACLGRGKGAKVGTDRRQDQVDER